MSPLAALLLLPLRGHGAWVIGGWALFAWVLRHMLEMAQALGDFYTLAFGLLILAWIVVIGVLQQYAWLIMQRAALGHTTPYRRIELDQVSPLANPLAAKVAALVLAIVGLLDAAWSWQPGLGLLILAATVSLLPAMLAVMVMEDRFLPGCTPGRVVDFIRRLGPPYLIFAPTIYLAPAAVYLALTINPVPGPLLLLTAGYVFLLGNTLAGRLLYSRRASLDLATEVSPEQDIAAAWQETNRQIDDLLTELHRLCAGGEVRRAHVRLDRFLAADQYELDDVVHERLRSFQDERLMLEHAYHYLTRLLANGKPARAWHLLKRCLDVDSRFRPASDGEVLDTLAAFSAAGASADAHYADLLLSDFERAYPSSPRLPDALFVWARCNIDHLGKRDKGLVMLARIRNEFPDFAKSAVFSAYYAAARLKARPS